MSDVSQTSSADYAAIAAQTGPNASNVYNPAQSTMGSLPQSNSQPVIPTSTLTSTQPLNIPSTNTSSGNKPAQSILGMTAGLNNGQVALQTNANQIAQNAEQNFSTNQNSVTGLVNNYLGKGDAQIQAENDANIPQMRTTANDLTTQYQTKQLAYNNAYNAILNKPGLTAEQSAQAINDLTQEHSYDLANTGILQAIAQNQYQTAQTLVDHQIDVKYAPIKDAIDYGMQFLSMNKDILTQAEQNSFQAKLQTQTQQYTEASYNDHLIKDTQVSMMKEAAENGAPQDVLASMQSAQGIGETAQAGGQYLKNASYSPIQTGIDQNTGLPIYSALNTKTGQLQPLNPGGAFGQTGSQDTVVNGYQMGATTTMGAYASATSTQVSNIKNTVAKIQASVGTITDSTTAQSAIAAVAPKSPITGDMVMAAATKYGVDPATIIGVMQAETQCGTDGSKGAKQCNYGNVGNTDSLMASGKSVAMKPQDGVDAVAKNLSERQVQPGQVDPTQASGATALTQNQVATQTIKNAPQLIQSAMNSTLSSGQVFIDSSKLSSDSQKYIANAYSAKSGVPVLNADQVSVVKGADEAIRNITDVIAPAWQAIAPQNYLGKITNNAVYPASKLGDTDFYVNNNTFKTNKENLAQQIRALSQSAPKGSLLSTAASALPDNSGYGGFGGTYDTLKDGNSKLQRTLDLLNQTVKTFLPNATPVTLNTAQPIPITAPDGNQYIITP